MYLCGQVDFLPLLPVGPLCMVELGIAGSSVVRPGSLGGGATGAIILGVVHAVIGDVVDGQGLIESGGMSIWMGIIWMKVALLV